MLYLCEGRHRLLGARPRDTKGAGRHAKVDGLEEIQSHREASRQPAVERISRTDRGDDGYARGWHQFGDALALRPGACLTQRDNHSRWARPADLDRRSTRGVDAVDRESAQLGRLVCVWGEEVTGGEELIGERRMDWSWVQDDGNARLACVGHRPKRDVERYLLLDKQHCCVLEGLVHVGDLLLVAGAVGAVAGVAAVIDLGVEVRH